MWLPSLAIAVVLVLPASASAQTFGVEAGIDLTKVVASGSYTSTGTAQAGAMAGGFVRWQLGQRYGAQVDALVTQKRSRIAGVVADRLTYLEVPVTGRYRLLPSSPVGAVDVVGGLVFASRLKATETVGGATTDLGDAVTSTDLGGVVGVDAEVRPRWIASVRYLYGVRGVYNTLSHPAGMHRTFQITLAYRLR